MAAAPENPSCDCETWEFKDKNLKRLVEDVINGGRAYLDAQKALSFWMIQKNPLATMDAELVKILGVFSLELADKAIQAHEGVKYVMLNAHVIRHVICEQEKRKKKEEEAKENTS